MGRPKLPDEERARRQKEAKKRWRDKSRGSKKKGKSWLNRLEKNLQTAASLTDDLKPHDATPPDRPGEPFADLPPLDLPGTAPAVESESGSTPTDQATSSDATASSAEGAPKAEVPKTEKEKFVDTEMMQQMAEDGVYKACMFLGEYAGARGQFALGEIPCRFAGKAAAVLVKHHAADLNLDDETGAAWIVGGVVGVNSVQAFRAYKAEKEEKERKEAAPHVQPKPDRAAEPNGASPTAVEPPHFVPAEKSIIVRPGQLV